MIGIIRLTRFLVINQLADLFFNLEFSDTPAITPSIELAKLALVTSRDEEEDEGKGFLLGETAFFAGMAVFTTFAASFSSSESLSDESDDEESELESAAFVTFFVSFTTFSAFFASTFVGLSTSIFSSSSLSESLLSDESEESDEDGEEGVGAAEERVLLESRSLFEVFVVVEEDFRNEGLVVFAASFDLGVSVAFSSSEESVGVRW